MPDCTHTWCKALLWIVPDRVFGTWEAPEGELVMEQAFQFVTGTLAGGPVTGRLRGSDFSFTVGAASYNVRVLPGRNVLEGTVTRGGASSPWRATRR